MPGHASAFWPQSYIYIYSFFSGSLCRRCHWCRRNFSWCCCLSTEGALIPPHMVSPRKPPKMVQSMEDLEVALPGKLVLILWTLLVHLGGLRGNFSWCCCLSAEGALIPPNMVSPRKPPKMVQSMEDLEVALPGKLVLILWTLLVHLGGLRGNFSWCCCLSAEGALIPPNMVSPRKPPKMVHSMEDLDVALPGHCPSLISKHDES